MANPAATVEEAIGAAMDGWHPENGKELHEFLKAFPDVIDKLREAFAGIIRGLDDRPDLETAIGDDLDQVDSCLGNGHDAARTLQENFYHHYKFFLADDEE